MLNADCIHLRGRRSRPSCVNRSFAHPSEGKCENQRIALRRDWADNDDLQLPKIPCLDRLRSTEPEPAAKYRSHREKAEGHNGRRRHRKPDFAKFATTFRPIGRWIPLNYHGGGSPHGAARKASVRPPHPPAAPVSPTFAVSARRRPDVPKLCCVHHAGTHCLTCHPNRRAVKQLLTQRKYLLFGGDRSAGASQGRYAPP
jgi:hypothetical protein